MTKIICPLGTHCGAGILDHLLDDVLAAFDVEDDGAVALERDGDQFADPLDTLILTDSDILTLLPLGLMSADTE